MTESALHDAMRRALSIAAHGPADGVNPRVGCVILAADGRMLAEGWHRGAGTPHAEVDALRTLAASAAAGVARGSTVVVTLEPCNHTGRTGPCAQALIEAGVARVVYAVADPGEQSSGGAATLAAAGITVRGGLLEAVGESFLGDWLTTARLGRPLVSVKWAASLDGRAAAADGSSRWITGPVARHDVHRRRAAAQAIVVGTGTVLADDPSLTARDAAGELLPTQPVPVVIGRRGTPAHAALRRHPRDALLYATDDLSAVLADLLAQGIRHVFVEGGPTLASAFVAAGLVDEYLVYLAPTLLGGPRLALGDIGVADIDGQRRLTIDHIEQLGDDVLIVARPSEPPPPAVPLRPRAAPVRTVMFTGIIEELGSVDRVDRSPDAARLTIRGPLVVAGAGHGDSISVSGVCLTVVDRTATGFTADVMQQTLDMSTLDAITPGMPVNLERAAVVGGRLGGHIVQGHIDGTSTVLAVTPGDAWRVLRFSLSTALAPLVVDKGSIAIDGVSLTVSNISPADAPAQWFEVSLIPETLAATTLGERRVGDRVNIETDIVARHVERMLALASVAARAGAVTTPETPRTSTDPDPDIILTTTTSTDPRTTRSAS